MATAAAPILEALPAEPRKLDEPHMIEAPGAPDAPDILDVLDDVADRPRERLWRTGTQSLGDAELIALILGTGVRDRPVLAVASDLVRSAGGLAGVSRATPHELAQVSGVGAARAAQVAAAFELGRRAVEITQYKKRLGHAEDVYRCVAARLACVTQEVVIAIGVDARNGLLDIVEVARGSLAHVEVHPREVFRPLIRMAAAGGVLVHNHPSGDVEPGPADVELTQRMREAGKLLGLPIVDHVVVGNRCFRSMAEWLGSDF